MWGHGNAPTCVKLTIYFFSTLTKLVNWGENMQWSQWKILVACLGRWPRHVLLPLFVLQMCYGCAVRSLQFNCCCEMLQCTLCNFTFHCATFSRNPDTHTIVTLGRHLWKDSTWFALKWSSPASSSTTNGWRQSVEGGQKNLYWL